MTPRQAIVIGSDRLGLRIGEQLEADGLAVTLLAVPGSWLAQAALPAQWTVIRAQPDAPGVLAQAGLSQADVLLAVSDEDELNLGAALAACEVRPGLQLVLRQFNVRLARLLEGYLPQARILSLSASTAPTFALAALGPGVVFAHDTGADSLVLREVGAAEASPQERARALALSVPDGVAWLPGPELGGPVGARLLVATRGGDMPRYEANPPEPSLTSLAATPAEGEQQQLLAYTLLALLGVLFGVAALFAWRLKLSSLDAVYFVSTILTTVGFGDFNLRDADAGSKLVGILTMFAGLLLSTLLVGLVTNKLLSRQEQRRRGHYRQRLSGHVVVCGVGTMGVRIAEALRRIGETVVAVDPGPRAGFAALLRAAGVPLVEGDGCDERALLFANLPGARALVVATSRDHRNLEMALVARSLVPALPVVLRLFDPDLCRRVAGTFGIEASFSGTTLGAGLFTAFADRGTRLASLHFAGQAYALHRLEAVAYTSVAELGQLLPGLVVAACEAGGRLRVAPAASEALEPGASLFVLVPERPRGHPA